MIIDDMARENLQKAASAALALAGSLLTNEQAMLVGIALEGGRREAIAAALLQNVPREDQRVGVLAQLITSGKTREIAFRIQELIQCYLEVAAYAAQDTSWAHAFSERKAENALRTVDPSQFGLNSPRWYTDDMQKANEPYLKAPFWRKHTMLMPPELLFAIVGVTPRMIGSGFQGSEELKGHLPFGLGAHTPGTSAGTTPATSAGSMLKAFGVLEEAE